MQKNNLTIQKNVSLKNFNTFHLGGKTKYLIEAYSTTDLITAIKFCNTIKTKYKIIGMGSNLIFDDLGYNGAIIINRSSKIRFYKNYCFADSGAPLGLVIKKMLSKQLSGLEELVGIPSTIGGGIVNNVGAFLKEISSIVEYVECVHRSNLDSTIKLKKEECKFNYRNSLFKDGDYIITKVKLRLNYDNYLNIAKRINYYSYQKSSTQPINSHSAGSIFKRTPLTPASKLIDDSGLKGYSIGGASVSTLHAGFIVAKHHTKSSDVKSLIRKIKQIVYDKYGITLEEEVEYVEF